MRTIRILILDPRRLRQKAVETLLERAGIPAQIRAEEPQDEIIDLLKENWDFVLSEIPGGRRTVESTLSLCLEHAPASSFIVVTRRRDIPKAATLCRAGASDYIALVDLSRLVITIERELRIQAGKSRLNQAAQELERADKMIALGILVSGVAHEINNPNQFIVSHIAPIEQIWRTAQPILDRYAENNGDFLIAGELYSLRRNQVPSMFESMREGTKRIQTIVRELRDYVLEHPDAKHEEISINSVVKSAMALLANLLAKSTRNFTLSLGHGIPSLNGHYQRIEQVIINLMQNACQSLESKDKAIALVTRYIEENNVIQIEITDEGKGISAEDLPRIGDPFFTTKRATGGTGLGLSISNGIIKEHRGQITFSSTPGIGTTASITLPCI